MTDPVVVWKRGEHLGGFRIRLEGGTLTEEWRGSMRAGRTPWCEITIRPHGSMWTVDTFGGEVWPSAWPHLFDCNQYVARGTFLTEAGRKLLGV
jgi:hypothetical protein